MRKPWEPEISAEQIVAKAQALIIKKGSIANAIEHCNFEIGFNEQQALLCDNILTEAEWRDRHLRSAEEFQLMKNYLIMLSS